MMIYIAEDLNEQELALLHHSAGGNVEGVKEIFVQQSYYLFALNVNCADYLDRTALSLAILNRHFDVIKFLLSDDVGKLNTMVENSSSLLLVWRDINSTLKGHRLAGF